MVSAAYRHAGERAALQGERPAQTSATPATDRHATGTARCPYHTGARCETCGGAAVVQVMTRDELRAVLQANGRTVYHASSGRQPLSEWKPYGNTPDGVNYLARFGEWRGVLRPDGRVIDYAPDVAPPFVLGVWEFE